MSNIESLCESARRNGYAEAINDLYDLLKQRKVSGELTWQDLDLVRAMMEKEIETFQPKDKNLYDTLGSTLKDIQR